jgi:hypothetical protein
MSKMNVGDVLHNGAEVLAFFENKKHGVVLARWINDVTPYVTWKYFEGDPRSTTWGHYCHDYAEAWEDFQDRVSGNFAKGNKDE